jgi:superfamily II DNA/RNA helicase
MVVHAEDRINEIARMAGLGRILVFTRTKHRAKQLARKLEASGVGAVDLHGNLSQNARERNLAAFSDGTATALVATDIAARGIHVDDVPLVVHADPPVEHKAYTHRSGRTARAGAAGQVVTIATMDQVAEVRQLLRQAGVTATWEGLPVHAVAQAPRQATASQSRGATKTRSAPPKAGTSSAKAGVRPSTPSAPASGSRRPGGSPRSASRPAGRGR